LHQKLQSQTATREKLCKTLSYKKGASKMLMKFAPENPLNNDPMWNARSFVCWQKYLVMTY
jgi:hypothetical protein